MKPILCPRCNTPIVEPLAGGIDGVFVRTGGLRISKTKKGAVSAEWICRRCGQRMRMNGGFAASAIELFGSMEDAGRPVLDVISPVRTKVLDIHRPLVAK